MTVTQLRTNQNFVRIEELKNYIGQLIIFYIYLTIVQYDAL